MRGFLYALIPLLAATLAYHFWPSDELRHPPGVLAPEPPVQVTMSDSKEWEKDEFHFTRLASFEMRARVLHTERYRFDHFASVCPVDVAFGWGRMSDQKVLDQIEIWQSRRWYFWKVAFLPIPRDEIIAHSANMHLIPETEDVEDAVLSLRIGDIVKLKGSLVYLRDAGGAYMRSSLRRDDVGDGSCEVIWVESLAVETDAALIDE